jgi:mRNA-degrading endonuclease toxin of MazEF toxin-antitoxin module/antitoxin component of MazEF toxin-antitoxin module
MEVLKIPVVRIGGSKGIRIPKKILEECNITSSVIASVGNGEITLKPERRPRQGWAEAAKRLHQQKEDKLLIDYTLDLSPDELNSFLATVIIAPLTTKVRNYPFRPMIRLGKVSGSIMLDQIRCVDKGRLAKRIGELPQSAIMNIKNVLKEMLVE